MFKKVYINTLFLLKSYKRSLKNQKKRGIENYLELCLILIPGIHVYFILIANLITIISSVSFKFSHLARRNAISNG